MSMFNVYRHPMTGQYEAIKQGFCPSIVLLNIIIPLG